MNSDVNMTRMTLNVFWTWIRNLKTTVSRPRSNLCVRLADRYRLQTGLQSIASIALALKKMPLKMTLRLPLTLHEDASGTRGEYLSKISETVYRPIWGILKLSVLLNQKILKLSIKIFNQSRKHKSTLIQLVLKNIPSSLHPPCLHFRSDRV